MENINEVYEFYNNGAEIDRLESGLGVVEFYRSKEIISRYITNKSTIYDIGGGIGKYSEWLAEQGNDVTLIELAPTAVDHAKQNMKTHYNAEVGDARQINKPDESADVVLLMGPLYHLQNKEDREKVLSEAYRVLKKGGCINIICEGSDPEAIDWPKIDGFFKIYRPSELQELLLEAHFKDVAVHHGQGQYISVVGVK